MTSVLNSSSQTAHAVKRPDKSIPSAKHGGHATDPSGEFGALFGSLMEAAPGQHLAAPAAADGKTSPKVAGLAAEVLGPSVHIITSAEPAISDDSLMAFARSQGMDEEALAMIFGRQAAATDSAMTGDMLPTAEASATDVLTAATLRNRSALSSLASLSPQEAAKANAAPDAAAQAGGAIELGADARISWQLGDGSNSQKPAAESLPTPMFGLNGMRSLLQSQEGKTATAKLEQAVHPEAPNQSLAASLILGASEASQSAKRLQMKQVSQRAERIADTLQPALAVKDPLAVSDGDSPLESLTIDTGLPETDLQLLLQQRQPDGGQSANDDGLPAAANADAPRSDIAERADQYDKLSQRLGEALGQRLAAQIAKGDWKVEMALRPIDLGKVDIELRMHQGELQASFHASEASTRDLIMNGLPKLKEVLAQLGMEVANVDVNVRQESQSGGNPTPGQPSPGIAAVGNRGRSDEAAAPGELPAARSVKLSDNGLDLLV